MPDLRHSASSLLSSKPLLPIPVLLGQHLRSSCIGFSPPLLLCIGTPPCSGFKWSCSIPLCGVLRRLSLHLLWC
jgi:hypothetical protein